MPKRKAIQRYNKQLSETELTGDDIVLPRPASRTTWAQVTEVRICDTELSNE